MTTVRHLRLVNGAGDVDPTLALRIDVVRAAEAFADALESTDHDCVQYAAAVADAEEVLRVAVSRMRRARQRRRA